MGGGDEWMRWVLRHHSGRWYREHSLGPVKPFSLATTYPTKEAAEKATKLLTGYTPELVNVREEWPPPRSAAVVARDLR